MSIEIDVICENCGIEFKREKHLVDKRKNSFCSSKCQHIWRTGKKTTKASGENKKCLYCGKEFYAYPYEVDIRKYCSNECKLDYARENGIHAGENCNFWIGGTDNYRGQNWNYQRSKARKRDNNTCKLCGKTKEENNKNMTVHHIVPFRFFMNDYKKANDLDNLICLCSECHGKQLSHGWVEVPNEYKYLLNGVIPQEQVVKCVSYTDEEIEYMIKNYSKLGATEMSKKLNRTIGSLLSKASELNLKYEYWSEEEISILKNNYSASSKQELLKLLPSKSYLAIKSYANSNGLFKKPKWSEEDKNIIYTQYPIYGINHVCKLIPHKTKKQIKSFIDNHKISKQ
jgi:endogenous inhibitor of DNA gyrase (YacG/DUF329 family)